MQRIENPHHYDGIARTLHWSMACLMLAAIPLGLTAGWIGPRATQSHLILFREELLFWHKSIGVSVLILAVFRLFWAVASRRPLPPRHLPKFERITAKTVHVTLYALMFAMPVSGILLSQSVGHPVSFFGLFSIPTLFVADPSVPVMQRLGVKIGFVLHKRLFDYLLFVLLLLHWIGVAKHLFIDRDKTIWARMSPLQRSPAAVPTEPKKSDVA